MDKHELICTIKTRTQIPWLYEPLGIRSVIEVGVWRGQFFKRLIEPVHIERAVAVDAWDSSLLSAGGSTQVDQSACERMYEKMMDLSRNTVRPVITVLRGDSPAMAKMVQDNSFGLIYIDADHRYDGALRDLVAWYPKLKDGGVLCGHDYLHEHYYIDYGVVEAVDDFRAKYGLEFFHTTKESYPSWFLIKGE